MPALGLGSVPNIDSSGITVDGEDNFILAVTSSSLYGGGPGVAHINSSLTAFLADPTTPTDAIPPGISYQDVDGTNYLALTDPGDTGFGDDGTFTIAGELPLFSGQVSPEQLREAYGVNQINFTTLERHGRRNRCRPDDRHRRGRDRPHARSRFGYL